MTWPEKQWREHDAEMAALVEIDEQWERDAKFGAAVKRALANYEGGPVGIHALRHWANGLENSHKPLAAHIMRAIADALDMETDNQD